MAEIFQFKPKATLTAAQNLGVFISKCRVQLIVFGSDLNWEAPVWPNITVFGYQPAGMERSGMESG